MANKVAKLVWVTVGTRVIVNETDTDLEVLEAARNRLMDNIRMAGTDVVDEIKLDTEMPYGIDTSYYSK